MENSIYKLLQGHIAEVLFYFTITQTILACSSGYKTIEQKQDLELSGLEKYDKNDFKGALADFDLYLKSNPNDTSAYVNRARAKAMMKDYGGSMQDNTKAIQLDPNCKKALLNRALDKSALNDSKGAVKDYTKLIELRDDELAEVYQKRGSCKLQLNDSTGAVEDFKKSIEIQPKNPSAYINMAIVHLNSQTQLALREANKAFEFDSQYPSAFFVRGLINLKLKMHHEGCGDLLKAISLNYEPANSYYEKYCKSSVNQTQVEPKQKSSIYSLKFNKVQYINATFTIPENKIWIAPIGYRCDAIKYPDCMKGEPFIGDRWNGYIMLNDKDVMIYTWTEGVVDKFNGMKINVKELSNPEKAPTIDYYRYILGGNNIGPSKETKMIAAFEFDLIQN